MTLKKDHAYADRVNRNQAKLIMRLSKHLSSHIVEVFNKQDQTTSRPEPVAYYEMMLFAYYLVNVNGDKNYQPFNNIDEHYQDILNYIEFSDDELEVKLVKGKVSLPSTFQEGIKLPHTFYTDDEIIFKRYG